MHASTSLFRSHSLGTRGRGPLWTSRGPELLAPSRASKSSGGDPFNQIQARIDGFVKEAKPKVAEVIEDAKR